MAGKSKKNPLAALMAVPGIGKATAEKLNKAGIKTPAGIKKAGKKGLEKAGISASLMKKLLASTPKKAAPKKKTAKKAAPKKAAAKTGHTQLDFIMLALNGKGEGFGKVIVVSDT